MNANLFVFSSLSRNFVLSLHQKKYKSGKGSMSGLNAGIYFLKAFIGDEVYSAKFVKR
jgi:hypothetical protein